MPRLSQPVPELPAKQFGEATIWYRDNWGFEIAWEDPAAGMGAVNRDDCSLFLRSTKEAFQPSKLWIYCPEIDVLYEQLRGSGEHLVEPIETKPWGLVQFSMRDLNGHILTFHCDIGP